MVAENRESNESVSVEKIPHGLPVSAQPFRMVEKGLHRPRMANIQERNFCEGDVEKCTTLLIKT